MDFKNNKPIYLQIVDFCFRKILIGEWREKGRIPSVRELSVDLQVNPNTSMRAFEYLTNENVIFSERGKGYFVSENAKNQILALQKKEFFNEILPDVFSQMKILGISIEEIVASSQYQVSSGDNNSNCKKLDTNNLILDTKNNNFKS